MPIDSPRPVSLLDGEPATIDQLAPLAFAGFAHFTALQVRDGRARGLDLHLARLSDASRQLFGAETDSASVRSLMHAAVAASGPDLSMTVTVFTAGGEFTAAGTPRLRVLVRTAPPATGPAGPLTAEPVEHERYLPRVKTVAETAKTHLLQRAKAHGYDDAVFLDRRGRLSEGTIWNLAFSDGDRLIWPEAESLTGTMQSTVRRGWTALGLTEETRPVHLADLPSLSGAVLLNSWTPGIPLTRIGDTPLPVDTTLLDRLHTAYASQPAEEV